MASSTHPAATRLDAAVLEIQAAWNEATQALSHIGRIVLDTCFDGDARRLLGEGADREETFVELSRRLGALGVGIDERTLSVALRIAAYDALVRGNHWKLLDQGRKQDLLPLHEPQLLASGAKFAVEMSPTRANLRKWVAGQRALRGRPPTLRGMGLKGARTALGGLKRLAESGTVARLEREFATAKAVERRKVLAELGAARASLAALEKRLRAQE